MSLKYRKFAYPLLFVLALTIPALPQDPANSEATASTSISDKAPTSAEVMRERISRAKALIAVKNYPAAIYELENIRRESVDETVHRVLNVLLMSAYLEQGDYKRAQNLLNEVQKSKSQDASASYLSVAGQVVHGARTQAERYRSLGLSVTDRNLPIEASADLENMRATLELVIEQAKTMTADRKLRPDAVALLEESSSARANIARDAYDSKRWKDQVADAREQMIGTRSVIISAVGAPKDQPKQEENVAKNDQPPVPTVDPVKVAREPLEDLETLAPAEEIENPITTKQDSTEATSGVKPSVIEKKPVPEPVAESSKPNPAGSKEVDRPVTETILPTDRPIRIIRSAERSPSAGEDDGRDRPNVKSTISEKREQESKEPDTPTDDAAAFEGEGDTLSVGSLIGYATRRVNPVYPVQARNMRMTGVVTVEVLVDEDGRVAEVNETDGPMLLRRAASDAVRKWQFRPFKRDGRPVKATGFVSFNFDL